MEKIIKIKKTCLGGLTPETLGELVRLKIEYQAEIKKKINNDEFGKVLCDALELMLK